MPTFQCPACKSLIQLQLPPQQPVQDIIVQWCPNAFKDDRPNVASVTEDNTLILGLTNQEGKRVFINVKLGVDMPITRETYAVLYEGKPVKKAVEDLMARELTEEFEAPARITLPPKAGA